jgi:hypothetical protein
MIDIATFKNLIEAIRKRASTGAQLLYKDDLNLLVMQILTESNKSRKIVGLEHQVQAIEEFDLDALKSIVEELSKANNSLLFPLPHEGARTLGDFLGKLKEGLVPLDGKQHEFGKLEIMLRAELFFDSLLNKALMCVIDDNPTLENIETIVGRKLKELSDGMVSELWAKVRSEFDKDQWVQGLPLDYSVLPSNFLSQEPVKETRDKIVHFLVRYKPRLWIKAFSSGTQGIPLRSPGLAKVALMRGNNVSVLSAFDVMLFNSLLRIAVYLEKARISMDPKRIFQEFGILESGRILGSSEYKDIKKELDDSKLSQKEYVNLLLDELAGLLDLLSPGTMNSTPILTALLQYRLSIDLFTDENRERILKIKGGKELRLQRELCGFLLVKGIYSFGASFGDMEIDLLAKESPGETYVIETKVYSKPPTEGSLNANISQLLKYMHSHSQSRGILFIYNLTDRTVVTPDAWIKGSIACFAANIGKRRASELKETLVVRESVNAGEFVTVMKVSPSAR